MVLNDVFSGVSLELTGSDFSVTRGGGAVEIFRQISRSEAVGDVEVVNIPAETFRVAGKTLSGVDIYCHKRIKGDEPGCERLDASGVLTADSVMLFSSGATVLLIGFLELDRHMCRIECDENGIRAVAEFHPAYIAPEAEFPSQAVLISCGSDPNELLRAYACKVLEHYPVRQQVPRLTVCANWHFFGPTMTEEQLDAELADIRFRQIPLDVYQLDDGWERCYGNWSANAKWHSGMAAAAAKIRSAGMTPGIWVTPFLCSVPAEAKAEFLLREESGKPVTMRIGNIETLVYDPSHPGMRQWITGELRKLREAGFTYYKVDFCRGVYMNTRAVPHDRQLTLLQLYRLAISTIREAVGDDAVLNICGGHETGSIGLADIARTGSDTYGVWHRDGGVWLRIRQCVMRTWLAPWRHGDPDASIIRLNNEPMDLEADFTPHHPIESYSKLPLGELSDDEAKTMMLNQFLCGGIVEIGESFPKVSDARLALVRRVVPAYGEAAEPIDFFTAPMPHFYRTRITARAEALGSWQIISAINVSDRSVRWSYPETLKARTLLFDLSAMRTLGIFEAGSQPQLPEIPPHASLVVKPVTLPDDGTPVFVATDLHYSGGGVEVTDVEISAGEITGVVDTPWQEIVTLTGAFRDENGCWHTADVTARAGERFTLKAAF